MDPYRLLGIDKDVSNKEIIQAAALQMRQKQYSAKEIALAQKLLLDPISRGCQAFLYHIDFNGIRERLPHTLETPAPSFNAPCLTLFDDDENGF